MWDCRARVGDKEQYFPASARKVGAIIFLLFIFWQLPKRIHTHIAFRGEKNSKDHLLLRRCQFFSLLLT